ncbi:MAG: hypothetical protein KH202_05130 [Clostridiales bacterium]|nr:hypothetical protein [Clostridiales bacterium]
MDGDRGVNTADLYGYRYALSGFADEVECGRSFGYAEGRVLCSRNAADIAPELPVGRRVIRPVAAVCARKLCFNSKLPAIQTGDVELSGKVPVV